MKRESGWYKVTFLGKIWLEAYYSNERGSWRIDGKTIPYYDYDFLQIDENQIKRAEDDECKLQIEHNLMCVDCNIPYLYCPCDKSL